MNGWRAKSEVKSRQLRVAKAQKSEWRFSVTAIGNVTGISREGTVSIRSHHMDRDSLPKRASASNRKGWGYVQTGLTLR